MWEPVIAKLENCPCSYPFSLPTPLFHVAVRNRLPYLPPKELGIFLSLFFLQIRRLFRNKFAVCLFVEFDGRKERRTECVAPKAAIVCSARHSHY